MIICKNEKIAIRELEEQDAELLLKWLSDPQVLEYYEGRDHRFDEKMVTDKFYALNFRKTRCIIEYCDIAIGYLQFYPLDEGDCVEYGYEIANKIFYGIDLFIGETQYWNKGIGTELMKKIIAYLMLEKDAQKIVIDPHCRNVRAIACYEKSGFKKIRRLLKNEMHEGQLEDCWLMEYSYSKDRMD